MKAADYIDAIKERHQIDSDYAAAKLLGITRSAISNYRRDGGSLADAPAIRAAELLDMDPASVLIDCQMERAPDPATRAAWGALLTRLGAHAAPLAVLLLLVTFGPDFLSPESLSSAAVGWHLLLSEVERTPLPQILAFALLSYWKFSAPAYRFNRA